MDLNPCLGSLNATRQCGGNNCCPTTTMAHPQHDHIVTAGTCSQSRNPATPPIITIRGRRRRNNDRAIHMHGVKRSATPIQATDKTKQQHPSEHTPVATCTWHAQPTDATCTDHRACWLRHMRHARHEGSRAPAWYGRLTARTNNRNCH
jgi:hypothetical protein